MALQGNSLVQASSESQETLWILLWGLLGGTVGLWVRGSWRFCLIVVSGLLAIGFLADAAMAKGWWIPLVPPAMAWGATAAISTAYISRQEQRQRELLMQIFSRSVSPEIAETIWQEREYLLKRGKLRSQKQVITVLFTDLEGFTTVAEEMDPQTLLNWLNAYMDSMAKLVMDYGGVVDDYYGDAIKANFGVPFARTSQAEIRQDATNAVRCALAMEREINRLNRSWQEQGYPTVHMRIGICTGQAVAGSLGSAQRLKYTTVGDTVNIAARIEQFEKESTDTNKTNQACRILISGTTLLSLNQNWPTREVGKVRLKGKCQTVTIHRVLGERTEETAEFSKLSS